MVFFAAMVAIDLGESDNYGIIVNLFIFSNTVGALSFLICAKIYLMNED